MCTVVTRAGGWFLRVGIHCFIFFLFSARCGRGGDGLLWSQTRNLWAFAIRWLSSFWENILSCFAEDGPSPMKALSRRCLPACVAGTGRSQGLLTLRDVLVE